MPTEPTRHLRVEREGESPLPIALWYWRWFEPRWKAGTQSVKIGLAVLIAFAGLLYVSLGPLVFDAAYWVLGKIARTASDRRMRVGVSISLAVVYVVTVNFWAAADANSTSSRASATAPAMAANATRSRAAATYPAKTRTPTAPPAPTPARMSWTINSPANGDKVGTASVAVAGAAPSGTRVVQDIPMAPDKDAVADGSGRWSILVSLKKGDNTLTFRVGDDKSTSRQWHITYDPSLTPTPAPAPTQEARPSPVAYMFSGPGNEPAPVEKVVTLPAGVFGAHWSIKPAGDCGATIALYRVPDDGFAWNIAGVSVSQPVSRTDTSESLPAGKYEVSIYVGCPWTITLTGPTTPPAYTVTRGMIADAKRQWDKYLAAQLQILTFSDDKTSRMGAAMAIKLQCRNTAGWVDSHTDFDPTYQTAVGLWRQAVVGYQQGGQDVLDGLGQGDNALYAKGVKEIAAAGDFVSEKVEPAFAVIY